MLALGEPLDSVIAFKALTVKLAESPDEFHEQLHELRVEASSDGRGDRRE